MLRTLALLALVCLCVGAKTYRRDMSMPDNADLEPMNSEPMPFRAHTEHRFVYNMQIASGLIASSDEDAISVPQQKAVMRGQCLVLLQFASERHAQLRLEQCRVGEQNEPMSEPQMVQPMDAFEPKWIPGDKQKKLELPCQFSYEDGVIERVQFHEEDDVWSKNMKRAVLNMVQMNLKANNQQQEEQGIEKGNQHGKTYTIPETTLEGACQTSYTTYKVRGEQPQPQHFNVTKSIDFKQCQQIADVAYGYQSQQPQAKCAHCKQFWAQQHVRQQQNGEQHPCAKCDPKEVKEQELDRSTVIRCQIQKDDQEDQQIALKRCELVSQYVYRNGKIDGSAMQTVISASLEARGGAALQAEAEQQIPALESGKEESLMYSNQWELDVKRFYMFGDDEFGQNGKDSPFARVPKMQHADQALRKLAQAMEDKQRGIEQQAPAQLQRLVEMMRQSTHSELKRIEQNARNAQEKQIFTNALAVCGTRNCVDRLAEKIKNKEIHSAQAVQSLLALNQLPAPSDPIVQEIEQLCASSELAKEQPELKQSCWLTFGALVNELCQYKTEKNAQRGQTNGQQSGFYREEQCPMDKRQQYKEAMMAIYQNSDCIYDKMVALAALGNAGLDISVGDLEQIIKNPHEARVVRVKAIDALRRLRVQMPRKIQRILVPIFQNTREHAQVRTAAFAIAMYTQPESQVVDQLMYTIAKEPNKQVRSFAYRTMRMMANSQKPNERKMAQHIKAALKLAKVEEQELRGSGKWQVPLLYNQEQEEGIFVTLATTISAHSALPVYAHAQLDSQFNEHFQINTAKLYMMQQEAEQWYRKVVGQKTSQAQRQTGNRYSDNLRNIFKSLGIKGRQSDQGQDQDKEDNEFEQYPYPGGNNQPFAMLCIRTNDVDRGFLALDQHFVSEESRQLMNSGDMQKLYGLAKLLLGQLQPQKIGTMVGNLHEKQAQIPTSAGLPLRLLNSMPILANVQGHTRVSTEQLGLKLDIDAQVAASVAHLQKMECWTPFVASGVQSARSIEINVPLQAEMSADSSQSISIKLQAPQHKTQLVGVRSLPITYTAAVDPRTGLVREPSRMRTVHNPNLDRQQHEVDMEVASLKSTAMPLRVQGHYHWPSKPTSFQQFAQLLMASENAVQVTYQPGPESPREITFRLSDAYFQTDGEQGITCVICTTVMSVATNKLIEFMQKPWFSDQVDLACRISSIQPVDCQLLKRHIQEWLHSYGPRFICDNLHYCEDAAVEPEAVEPYCEESEQCQEKCAQGHCGVQKKVSPVWKTKVSEQNHAVCFSANPVMQCPRGTVPMPSSLPSSGYFDELEQDQDDAQNTKNVHFVCLDRADPETRRLVRMLRQGRRVVDVAGHGSSFTERIHEPEQCQYRDRN